MGREVLNFLGWQLIDGSIVLEGELNMIGDTAEKEAK